MGPFFSLGRSVLVKLLGQVHVSPQFAWSEDTLLYPPLVFRRSPSRCHAVNSGVKKIELELTSIERFALPQCVLGCKSMSYLSIKINNSILKLPTSSLAEKLRQLHIHWRPNNSSRVGSLKICTPNLEQYLLEWTCRGLLYA
uniref:Uncharacterized protein n=1 Tax=Quercus lobata TaxID=97700 RepID=A0A7N2MWW5_QUELO